MKKQLFYFITINIFCFLLFSCKQEKTDAKKATSSEVTTAKSNQNKIIRGEFISIEGASIIKGKDFIYGIVDNKQSKELIKQVSKLKRNKFDMVPVIVQGIIRPNTEKGWQYIVDIQSILGISKPTTATTATVNKFDKPQNHTHHE